MSRNYHQYIESPDWRRKADAAKRRAGYRCQVCNRSANEMILNAHHRTYQRLGDEDDEDIIVLCRACHVLFHKHGHIRGSTSRIHEFWYSLIGAGSAWRFPVSGVFIGLLVAATLSYYGWWPAFEPMTNSPAIPLVETPILDPTSTPTEPPILTVDPKPKPKPIETPTPSSRTWFPRP